MSKGLIGSYSKAKNETNIKNEYKNNNPREIYIDKTVLNLFCTKKNINGIKVDKYTIKIKISFEAKVFPCSSEKTDNIKPKNNNTIIAKNSSNSTNSTNLIIKNNIVANKISDATENSIISPNLVKLLYVLFFILKLLSDKTIIIKKIIEDNILLLIIILDLKNSSISGISSFNGAEVNMPSKNKSKNDKNIISIVLLLIFSKLLSIINKNE